MISDNSFISPTCRVGCVLPSCVPPDILGSLEEVHQEEAAVSDAGKALGLCDSLSQRGRAEAEGREARGVPGAPQGRAELPVRTRVECWGAGGVPKLDTAGMRQEQGWER